MSEFERWIVNALRDAGDDADHEPLDDGFGARIVDGFLRRSRWVAGFAWMKMFGTLTISGVATIVFLASDSQTTKIGAAAWFVVGFVGFGIWWIWYWLMLSRGATLRELKRLELQISELRAERDQAGRGRGQADSSRISTWPDSTS